LRTPRLRLDTVSANVGSATDIVRESPAGSHIGPIALLLLLLLLIGLHGEGAGAA
jgi:hypothetical protein